MNVEKWCEYLNELAAVDPDAVTALTEATVPCNVDLLAHPTVQVRAEGGRPRVGLLGVLNGFLLRHGDRVAARATKDGRVVEFRPMDYALFDHGRPPEDRTRGEVLEYLARTLADGFRRKYGRDGVTGADVSEVSVDHEEMGGRHHFRARVFLKDGETEYAMSIDVPAAKVGHMGPAEVRAAETRFEDRIREAAP